MFFIAIEIILPSFFWEAMCGTKKAKKKMKEMLKPDIYYAILLYSKCNIALIFSVILWLLYPYIIHIMRLFRLQNVFNNNSVSFSIIA